MKPKEKEEILRDKYDDAIEYLTALPDMIQAAWEDPQGYEGRGGELFGFVAPDWSSNGVAVLDRAGVKAGTCGCLQQIRAAKMEGYDGKSGDMKMSFWPRLWDQIANDRRIPYDEHEITVEDLPVFAEWQRTIDILRNEEK